MFLAEHMPDFVVTFMVAHGRAVGFWVEKADGVAQAARVP